MPAVRSRNILRPVIEIIPFSVRHWFEQIQIKMLSTQRNLFPQKNHSKREN